MTDRDEFAKAALGGLLAHYGDTSSWSLINSAYKWADKMLAEREKSQPAKKGGDADARAGQIPGDQVARPASPPLDRLESIASTVREAWTPHDEGRNETGRADKPDEWDEMAETLLPAGMVAYEQVYPTFRKRVAAKLRELAKDRDDRLQASVHELGETYRQRDEARSRAEKAERERDEHKQAAFEMSADLERARADALILLDDMTETTRRLDAAERARDNALNALSAARALWSQAATERQAAQAKYREAVELMRPMVDHAATLDQFLAIARFVEAADKEGDNG